MADAVLGVLKVIVGGDTSDLKSKLADASKAFDEHGSKIAKVAAAIGVSITGAYSAVALGVSNTLKSMDEIGKQAQKIGIPTEQLSALRLAADLSGVSMEGLGKGVGKLSKAMTEAAGDPMSGAANAFKALKVSAVDANTGALRPVIDVTKDIATKFEGMKDGAGKTAVAMALFGKTGADLIPLLNAGGAGLEGMMNRAKALGITFSDETAKAAEKFRDTLTTLGAAKDSIIVKLTAHLLPALQVFADRMLAAASNTDKQQQRLSFLTTAFEALSRGVLLVVDNFKLLLQVGAVFAGASLASSVLSLAMTFAKLAYSVYITGVGMTLFNAIRATSMKGILLMAGLVALAAGAFDGFSDKVKSIGTAVESMLPEGGKGVVDLLAGFGVNVRALTDDLSNMKGGTDAASKGLKDFNFNALAGKNAVDTFINSQKKSLESTAAEVATFGMLPGAMEAAKVQLQALAIAKANDTTISATQQAQLDITKQKIIENNQALAALQLVQSNLTPSQLYQQELFKIQSLFDNGKLSAENYGIAMQKAAEKANTTWAQAGESIAGSFATIAKSFGKEGSAMAKAAQVFGVIQGTISMYTGAAKALELPFPANLAAMAAVLAKGAQMVASIKSQQVPTGFKTGGSFMVGGAGGADSQMVQFRASPGEQVDVWRPGEGPDPRGRAAGGGTQVIELRGLSGQKLISYDTAVEMIGAINDAIRFGGYKIVAS